MDFIFEPTLASERDQNEKRLHDHAEKGLNLDPNKKYKRTT